MIMIAVGFGLSEALTISGAAKLVASVSIKYNIFMIQNDRRMIICNIITVSGAALLVATVRR